VVLVDSSLWIPTLRESGAAAERERVTSLIRSGEAAWCAAVRLELWSGVGDARERKRLADLLAVVRELPMHPQVWEDAIALAERGRRKGMKFPYPDLLIFSCAREHGVELAHQDKHFDLLARLQA
jgi:hypothetical protein